ncbi:Glyoxylase, beta-lactamase superfamily II [Chitinophaga terrae (ex Kim and Jung 2007)]|uniref:Glyoxylase, beta-lactamase superfamily II n=1 Tax=Chitinophaga terrae (ex Kim and Jung 2007) TaxID=408074 RepID=A0A1H3XQI7_9BACT|nr:MBL fold metallo-hydrolase [Chitinophaga terrae (ex Kim and Jung 2007)]MDQ0105651.1 glyoxylase-like metal-dependent hydrolase (beta-lactamase superfamily II)/rhodanese-related sulfurtransferase [Chitinophaga terrae (ex Kim and Jung 2007)]GEP89325.1 MBL fold metallo-hydrolase [Chitinophaga terrae (ex Kim and Jung 2007)]SEA01616.1 Glyoxylase, beta-lactamase superfamily II [Chitinophaga terrae (ex Kim and Jung 2007)]
MFVKQLYTNCLSEAAYFIESDGVAAVIDPLRDIDVYLELAKERNATIQYIFETHFHADFVSGHLELAAATGAKIIYGPNAVTSFESYKAKDNETFAIGALTLQVLHTPGHTLESSCYLLKDEQQQPYALFTGDTLFVGDVGRPDLFSGNLTKEELAAHLFDSLNNKIKTLPDQVIVYPAHGPGSACGKNLGPNTFSTIGEQKATNYALLATDKEAFIQEVTSGLSTPPSYFPINAKINQEGYDALSAILEKAMKPLSPAEFKAKAKAGAVIVDTRNAVVFGEGFVPGSISIGLEGRFAEWAGSLLPFDQEIILVTPLGKEEETVVRLARVGFDNVVGYLEGSYEAWVAAGEGIDMIITVEPDELAMDLPHDPNLVILDVRKPIEFADGHIKAAINLPLNEMTDPGKMSDLEEHHNLYVHCQGGYRSIIACSLLKREGIHNLRNVEGGFAKMKDEKGLEVVQEKTVLN